MKKIISFVLLFGFVLCSLKAADSANDLILSQQNSGNTGKVQRNVAPAINSLLGFDGSKVATNITAGTGISIAGGVISTSVRATSAISASAIDWSLSNTYSKTLGASTTFTFSNQADGLQIVVKLTNTSGNYTVTWPAVSWVGGTPPVQTIGAHTDIYTFIDISGTIYGNVVQNF